MMLCWGQGVSEYVMRTANAAYDADLSAEAIDRNPLLEAFAPFVKKRAVCSTLHMRIVLPIPVTPGFLWLD